MEIREVEALLREQSYINGDGFVTIDQRAPTIPGDGNGLLQTGLWYVIKAQYGALTQIDRDKIQDLTERCKSSYCEYLWRSPYKKNPDDNQNHDDYWGWLAACYFAGIPYPLYFLRAAIKNKWFVDVVNPKTDNPKYFFGRFLDFPPFAKMCARGWDREALESTLQVYDHIIMASSILWSAFHLGSSDSLMRDYCRVAIARKESQLCAMVSYLWFYKLRKKFGITGMAFQGYFKNAAHPLCMGDWR